MNDAVTPPGKPEKPVKEKKEPVVRRSKFETMYPDDSKVTLLVEKNPKKEGSKSRERFEGYFGAKTIGEARKGGVTYADIAYDIGRQHISVG